MISATYRTSKGKYFRGNGRWAKVTQISIRREDGRFDVKFSVCTDFEGVFVSRRPIHHYGQRRMAENIAQDWIDYEG